MIDINEKICTYITKNWLIPWLKENKSQNSFAKNHDIEESTVRKIKSDTTYRIPVETLYKICKARKPDCMECMLINLCPYEDKNFINK